MLNSSKWLLTNWEVMILIGKSKPTRVVCGEELVNLGEKYPNLLVLEADISKSTYSYLFKEKYPDRYFNVGIAEQNLLSVAAGLSTFGFIPVVMTYAVFASMRACEQLRTGICYPNLNVKVFASHGGLTPGSDGATHQATEDLTITRAIPNLTIIMPCDETQTKKAVEKAIAFKGPVYMRLTRCNMDLVYKDLTDFEIGKAIKIKDGKDVTIIAIGDMVKKAIEASEVLKNLKIEARVLDMHTIKPLDQQAVIDAAVCTGAIVTVEDNNWFGGLGGAVCEIVTQTKPVPVMRIGIKDTFTESGEYEQLIEKYGMSVKHIVEAALNAIKLGKRGY